jgi:hypothetical protein
VRLGVGRIDGDRAPEGGERLVEAAEVDQGAAAVQFGACVVGLQGECGGEGDERAAGLALREACAAEVVVDVGAVGACRGERLVERERPAAFATGKCM